LIQRVTPRVHVEVDRLGSNNGIISYGAGRVVLIDTPHKPSDAIRWAEQVRAFGEVDYIVHTDHHPDHTIGNAFLDGVVVAHELTRDRMVDEPQDRGYLERLYRSIDPAAVDDARSFAPRLPTVTFADRLTLYGDDLRVDLHHVPGHTVNTIVAHLPDEGVVFTGDNVCPQGLPSFQDSAVDRWFDALDRIEALDFDVLVGGHGDVGGRELVERYRDMGRAVIGEVADAISRGVDRQDVIANIRFEDRIHTGTGDYVGYPEDICTWFQERSMARLYEDLVADPSLARR
jgi:cyclase